MRSMDLHHLALLKLVASVFKLVWVALEVYRVQGRVFFVLGAAYPWVLEDVTVWVLDMRDTIIDGNQAVFIRFIHTLEVLGSDLLQVEVLGSCLKGSFVVRGWLWPVIAIDVGLRALELQLEARSLRLAASGLLLLNHRRPSTDAADAGFMIDRHRSRKVLLVLV